MGSSSHLANFPATKYVFIMKPRPTADYDCWFIGSDENALTTPQAPPTAHPPAQVIYATPLPARSGGAPFSDHPIISAASSPVAPNFIHTNPYHHLATPIHYQPHPFYYTLSPMQPGPSFNRQHQYRQLMQYTFKAYNPQSHH
jgi:hypothetical protein